MKYLNILIVEDEAVLREVYEFLFKFRGHTVFTAANGVEGLKQIRAQKLDVVLLDIFMPVMDGKDVLRNIDTSDYPNTKFIVCSNLSDAETEAEVRELGAHDFVLKASLNPDDMVQLVENA